MRKLFANTFWPPSRAIRIFVVPVLPLQRMTIAAVAVALTFKDGSILPKFIGVEGEIKKQPVLFSTWAETVTVLFAAMDGVEIKINVITAIKAASERMFLILFAGMVSNSFWEVPSYATDLMLQTASPVFAGNAVRRTNYVSSRLRGDGQGNGVGVVTSSHCRVISTEYAASQAQSQRCARTSRRRCRRGQRQGVRNEVGSRRCMLHAA